VPILTLQRQFRELGRIRLGVQVPLKGRSGTRPEKLETFRLTAKVREPLDQAAELYGGKVGLWKDAQDGDAFELITTSPELDIIIPPGAPLSQWNEMWGGGGCLRRCDGYRDWLNDRPCQCPADPADRNALATKGEACKPTTRLSVALPRLPDVGIWLLVSHGYYAAVELMGTAELLQGQAEAGRSIPAILAIEKRSIKRVNEARKDIVVPIIRIPQSLAELLGGPTDAPALAPGSGVQVAGAPKPPELPAGPALPADPAFAAQIRPQSDPNPPAAADVPAQAARPVAAQRRPVERAYCLKPSPYGDGSTCGLQPGHGGFHKSFDLENAITGSWE
jgi:hypothetical protein